MTGYFCLTMFWFIWIIHIKLAWLSVVDCVRRTYTAWQSADDEWQTEDICCRCVTPDGAFCTHRCLLHRGGWDCHGRTELLCAWHQTEAGASVNRCPHYALQAISLAVHACKKGAESFMTYSHVYVKVCFWWKDFALFTFNWQCITEVKWSSLGQGWKKPMVF